MIPGPARSRFRMCNGNIIAIYRLAQVPSCLRSLFFSSA